MPRVAAQPFEEAAFSLSFKCDGCLFNAHCLHESNGAERLALVPHISAAETRLLLTEGIPTFRDLAALTRPAAPGEYHGPLAPAPGQEARLERLRAHWQLGGLDRLTQRARALVRARDRQHAPDAPGAGEPASPAPPPPDQPPPPSRPSTPPSAPSRTRAPTPAW